jgi:type IV pilus assembly protein PilE
MKEQTMKTFQWIETDIASVSGKTGSTVSCTSRKDQDSWRLVRSAGFTLIELMIVVAIIAILAAIAYPSYVTYITKSHRVAAEGCLSQYANYMERFYTTNLTYNNATTPNPLATPGATLGFDCASPQQTGSNYSYSLPSATSGAYVVQATPINAQLTRDTTCGTLTLDQTGVRKANGSTTLTGCW